MPDAIVMGDVESAVADVALQLRVSPPLLAEMHWIVMALMGICVQFTRLAEGACTLSVHVLALLPLLEIGRAHV